MTTELPATHENVARSYRDWGYASPFPEDSIPSWLGRNAGEFLGHPNFWTKAMDKGPAVGALTGAGIAAPLSFLGAQLFNHFAAPHQELDPTRVTALGGGLGAALGGLQGWFHTKGAALEQNPLQEAAQIISGAFTVSADQRSDMLAALPRLPPDDLAAMVRLMRTVSGSVLGALLVRFFMGKGLIGSALGAAAGGWLGSRPTNSFDSIYG